MTSCCDKTVSAREQCCATVVRLPFSFDYLTVRQQRSRAAHQDCWRWQLSSSVMVGQQSGPDMVPMVALVRQLHMDGPHAVLVLLTDNVSESCSLWRHCMPCL